MKSGDVIAFDGHVGFSALIKLFTKSPYLHVGMVLRDESALFGETLLLIKSTTNIKLSDADGKQAIKGVQQHFLSQRLAMFDGSAYWVRLKAPIHQAKLNKMLSWLRSTYAEKVPYGYARACGVALAKIEDACGMEIQPNDSTLFCSELVTKALQLAGIVNGSIDPTSQTPANVVNFNFFENPVLIKG